MVVSYELFAQIMVRNAHIVSPPWLDENGNVIGYDSDVGGVTGIFNVICAAVALGLANLCYNLGEIVERRFIRRPRIDVYRRRAWRAGLVLSCALPFSIPVLAPGPHPFLSKRVRSHTDPV